MNVRLTYLMIILTLLPSMALAQDEIFDYSSMGIELSMSNNFSLLPRLGSYSAQRLSAQLAWYPVDDYRQSVEYISTAPASKFSEGSGFSFEWQRPSETQFVITQSSRVTTKGSFVPVTKKVPFPLKSLESNLTDYLAPQEIIDITDKIKSLSSSLVEGEDDAFIAIYKLARWVEENVKYDLSTTTADASQKASWVLENRVGVCDELTSLFISMCRSLGIPARFVSGVAYSNINRQNDGWGPHGWAEVYLPEFGWIPVDVTYREIGYVDATHIKLRTSPDAKETSVEYSLTGQGVDIKAGALSFDVDILTKSKPISPPYEISLSIEKPEVGFGSFNLVTADIRNKMGYYISGKAYLSNVSELRILGSNRISFALAPYASKKFYFPIYVSNSLNENYMYTFPISINGEFGAKSVSSFRANSRSIVYSEEYVISLMPEPAASTKPYSDFLESSCATDKGYVHINENVSLTCDIKNLAPVSLNLKLRLDRNCTPYSLKSGASEQLVYSVDFDSIGVKTLAFRADGPSASKTVYIVVPVEDEPFITISNITYPEKLSFNSGGEIVFLLKRESVSVPLDVEMNLEHELIQHGWDFKSLEGAYEVKFLIKGSDLVAGENQFKVKVSYSDPAGRVYTRAEEFAIILENPTIFQRILLWLNALDIKLTRWVSSKVG